MRADSRLVAELRRQTARMTTAEAHRFLAAAARDVPGAGRAADVVARELGLCLPTGGQGDEG